MKFLTEWWTSSLEMNEEMIRLETQNKRTVDAWLQAVPAIKTMQDRFYLEEDHISEDFNNAIEIVFSYPDYKDVTGKVSPEQFVEACVFIKTQLEKLLEDSLHAWIADAWMSSEISRYLRFVAEKK